MARPQRNNVDYFPFYCEEGTKMYYLEETYGNDGFAVFLKILRELAKTDYHYLDLSKKTTRMFLSAKCKVSIEILEAIITDLVELEKFDAELWKDNSIVWCQDFIESIQDAYIKRSNNCIDRNVLVELLISKGVRKQVKRKPKPLKEVTTTPVNPQTILEDTILDKTKEEETGLIYPFESDEFIKHWCLWKTYKKEEYKFNYKSLISEQAALNELKTLSKENEDTAIKIINQSLAKGYKGLFELSKSSSFTKPQSPHQNLIKDADYSEEM